MKCPSDDCQFHGQGKFCPECGTKLVPSTQPVVLCRGTLDDNSPCTATLQRELKFCQSCGIQVDPGWFGELAMTCQSCRTVLDIGARFCSACGVTTGKNTETAVDETGDRDTATLATGSGRTVSGLEGGDHVPCTDTNIFIHLHSGLKMDAEKENLLVNVQKEVEDDKSIEPSPRVLPVMENNDTRTHILDGSGDTSEGKCSQSVKLSGAAEQPETLHLEQIHAIIPETSHSDPLPTEIGDGELQLGDVANANVSMDGEWVDEKTDDNSDEYHSAHTDDNKQYISAKNRNRKKRVSKKRRASKKKKKVTLNFQDPETVSKESKHVLSERILGQTNSEKAEKDTTINPVEGSKTEEKDTTINPVEGSKTEEKDTTVNPVEGSKTEEKYTTINPVEGSKTEEKDTTINPVDGSKTEEKDTTINPVEGSKTEEKDTTINSVEGSKTLETDTTINLVEASETEEHKDQRVNQDIEHPSTVSAKPVNASLSEVDTSSKNGCIKKNYPLDDSLESDKAHQVVAKLEKCNKNTNLLIRINAKHSDTDINAVNHETHVSIANRNSEANQQGKQQSDLCSHIPAQQTEQTQVFGQGKNDENLFKKNSSDDNLHNSSLFEINRPGQNENCETKNVEETQKAAIEEGSSDTGHDGDSKDLSRRQKKNIKAKNMGKSDEVSKVPLSPAIQKSESAKISNDGKVIQVYFHVLVSPNMKYRKGDRLILRLEDRFERIGGGWNSNELEMEMMRENVDGGLVEFGLHVDIPHRLIQKKQNYNYKYFMYRGGKNKKGNDRNNQWEFYIRTHNVGKHANRWLYIPDKTDTWHQFDGVINKVPKGGLINWAKNIIGNQLEKDAKLSLKIFGSGIMKFSDSQTVVDFVQDSESLVFCLRRMYLLDGNVWKDEDKFKNEVPVVTVGDVVRIVEDEEKAQAMQKRHGGWVSEMTPTLGKAGKVVKIDSDGDVAVSFGKKAFVYNPACCVPSAGDTPEDIASDMFAEKNSDSDSDEDNKDDISEQLAQMVAQMFVQVLQPTQAIMPQQFVKAAASNDSTTVLAMLKAMPDIVNRKVQGLTALILASHEGHSDVVRVLLKWKADMDATESKGNTALMAAVMN